MRTHRENHAAALLRLLHMRHATDDDIAAVCPHVMPSVARDIWRQHGRIAAPPTKVMGAYYEITPNESGGVHITARRTAASYQNAPRRAYLDTTYCPLIPQATHHGAEEWGRDLVVDMGRSGGIYLLLCPTIAGADGDAGFMGAVGASFAYDFQTLSRGIDAGEFMACVLHTAGPMSRLEADELAGDPKTRVTFRHCSYCGHWLAADHCGGCHRGFPTGTSAGDVPDLTRLPMPAPVIDAFQAQGFLQTADPRHWLPV